MRQLVCKNRTTDMTSLQHKPSSTEAENKGLLHAQVAEILRDRIIQSELEPGMRLTERVLCEELKVSRTPLREALKTLASEGLVKLLPNRGAIVIPLTLADTTQVFEVLGTLEGLAGELACAHAGDESVALVRELNQRMRECHRAGRSGGLLRAQSGDPCQALRAGGKPRSHRHLRQAQCAAEARTLLGQPDPGTLGHCHGRARRDSRRA